MVDEARREMILSQRMHPVIQFDGLTNWMTDTAGSPPVCITQSIFIPTIQGVTEMRRALPGRADPSS